MKLYEERYSESYKRRITILYTTHNICSHHDKPPQKKSHRPILFDTEKQGGIPHPLYTFLTTPNFWVTLLGRKIESATAPALHLILSEEQN